MIKRITCLLSVILVWLTGSPSYAETIMGSIDDPRLTQPMPYHVFQPEGSNGQELPAILMLHGHGGSERQWERGGKASRTLLSLIDEGVVGPYLLVTPGVGNSWYVSSDAYGAIDQVILDRLMSEIEANFTVKNWSIMGLSMGGYGALRLGFKAPERFTHIAALSPAIFKPGSEFGETQYKLFNQAYGDPFNREIYEQTNPFAFIPENPPPLYLSVGDHDFFHLEEGTLELYLALKQRGIRSELRVLDANHSWPLWIREFGEYLRWIAKSE